MAELGSHQEGVALTRQGVAAYEATGGRLGMPNLLALVAEACGRAGQTTAALDVLTQAQALVEETGERLDESTVYRLRAEMLLQLSAEHPAPPAAQEEAEACLHRAITVAHEQRAKPLELQATLSLARLWRQQGKGDAAREALARIHGSFSEGTDTADWREAQALLEALAADQTNTTERPHA
jgi:Predicted ATPase